MTQNRPLRVGLFGPYGFGNMGDAALVESAMQGLRRNLPGVELCGICKHPDNAGQRHQIETYPIFRDHPRGVMPPPGPAPAPAEAEAEPQQRAWKTAVKSVPGLFQGLKNLQSALQSLANSPAEALFMAKNYRLIRSLDAIVMPGSGQLSEEWFGPWSYPYALLKWCTLARLANCRIVFLGTGCGSLTSTLGRNFVRGALAQADHRSYRDPKTRDLAASLGVSGGEVVPDLVFGLRWDDLGPTVGPDAPRGRGVVGINPIPYLSPSWFEADPEAYAEYVQKMADVTQWLVEEGYRVLFSPTEIRADKWTINDIVARLCARGVDQSELLRPQTLTLKDVLAHVASCDFVIASRFHGALLSFLQQKPVLTLAFHFKLSVLAEQMGQSRYVLDIDSFQVDELQTRFGQLVEESEAAVGRIRDATASYREILEGEYRTVAQLVGVAPS